MRGARGHDLQHVAALVDDRREPGRRGLHHPAPVLDCSLAARCNLLGLHDRSGVARPVGRVDDRLATECDAFAGATPEEDLPRDRNGELGPVRQLEYRRFCAREAICPNLSIFLAFKVLTLY